MWPNFDFELEQLKAVEGGGTQRISRSILVPSLSHTMEGSESVLRDWSPDSGSTATVPEHAPLKVVQS